MRSHYSCRSSSVADADHSASSSPATSSSNNNKNNIDTTKNYYSLLPVSEIAFRGATDSANGPAKISHEYHSISNSSSSSSSSSSSTTTTTTNTTIIDFEQFNEPVICYNYHNNTGIEAEDTVKTTFHHTQFHRHHHSHHHHLPPTLIMQQQQQLQEQEQNQLRQRRPLNTTKIKSKNNDNRNNSSSNRTCIGEKTVVARRRHCHHRPTEEVINKNKLGFKNFKVQLMQILLQLLILCVAASSALEHQTSNSNHLLKNITQDNISSNRIIYHNLAEAALRNGSASKNSIVKTGRTYDENVSQRDSIEDYEDDGEGYATQSNVEEQPPELASKHVAIDGHSYDPNRKNYYGSCPSCAPRDKLKKDTLEMYKYRVLHKLGMEAPPNWNHSRALPKIDDSMIERMMNPHGSAKPSVTTTNNYEMIGDDPTPYMKMDIDDDDYYEEDYNYYSITQRVIALPIKSAKLRHQKRAHQEILQFNFDNNSGVMEANFHVYIHGEQWLRRTNPELLRTTSAAERSNITITIHKIIRSNAKATDNKAYHKEETIYEGQLPQGEGEYVRINITVLVAEWFRDAASNHGMLVKTYGQLAQKVTVLDANEKTPYIEYEVDDKRRPRHKRSALALNCDENDRESRCCRFPLTVDFEEFGWSWIIAPKKYDANYCSGECSLNFLPKYPHTHVWQLSNTATATPCCSPRQMSDLKLLYYDHKYNIVLSKIPSMIVKTCNCS